MSELYAMCEYLCNCHVAQQFAAKLGCFACFGTDWQRRTIIIIGVAARKPGNAPDIHVFVYNERVYALCMNM